MSRSCPCYADRATPFPRPCAGSTTSSTGVREAPHRRLDHHRPPGGQPELARRRRARRTLPHLSLFGYHRRACDANRMLPAALSDPWFDGWKGIRAAHLEAIRRGVRSVPISPPDSRTSSSAERLGLLAEQLTGARSPALLCDLEPLRRRRDRQRPRRFLAPPPVHGEESEIELGRLRDRAVPRRRPHRRGRAARRVGAATGRRLDDSTLTVSSAGVYGA